MDYKTFLKTVKDFHSDFQDTKLYFEISKRRNAFSNRKIWEKDLVRWLFETYLFKWGKMARVYPRKIRENLYRKFSKYAPSILEEYKEFDLELTSQNFETCERKIKRIYEKICELHVPYRDRKRRIGPTATSKLLHFFFPNLFIIWDLGNVREPQRYGDDSDEYFRYLKDKRQILLSIIDSYIRYHGGNKVQAVRAIENLHAKELPATGFKGFKEPITKMLDELNYSL